MDKISRNAKSYVGRYEIIFSFDVPLSLPRSNVENNNCFKPIRSIYSNNIFIKSEYAKPISNIGNTEINRILSFNAHSILYF